MAGPKRIHTVTQGYQRNFARGGRLSVLDVRSGKVELKPTQQVAMRLRWWGPEIALADTTERSLQQCEGPAVATLRRLQQRWPLSGDARAVVAQFLAIHVLRSSAWDKYYVRLTSDTLREAAANDRFPEGVFDAVADEFVSPRGRIDMIMQQIPRMGSLLCSMHWSLVAFERPLLGSGDHPVVPIPLMAAGEVRDFNAVPRTGFMSTSEIRFPVNPRILLLLTWLDGDREAELLRGDFRHAADVNRSTHGQAERHWFRHPDHYAPRLAPPLLHEQHCQPLGYELVPGYAPDAVLNSRRRAETDRTMQELIDGGRYDVMKWVVAERARTAEAA